MVDDDEAVRCFLSAVLEEEGHVVATATDGLQALEQLRQRSFHVVLADLTMPSMDGMALLKAIRRDYPETEVIVLTGYGSVESAVAAMKAGRLRVPGEAARQPGRADPGGRPGHASGGGCGRCRRSAVVGSDASARLRRARHAGGRARAAEGGGHRRHRAVDGRERHRQGDRRPRRARLERPGPRALRGRQLRRRCRPTLLESELFGHEKGAFTGAHARQRGRIELAEGGTFFLDEVGELEPGLQARLLRVIQEKRFERVGGQQAVDANVRWIAATNRDLPADGARREVPRGPLPPDRGLPRAACRRCASGARTSARWPSGCLPASPPRWAGPSCT